jgi:hypothetical protein
MVQSPGDPCLICQRQLPGDFHPAAPADPHALPALRRRRRWLPRKSRTPGGNSPERRLTPGTHAAATRSGRKPAGWPGTGWPGTRGRRYRHAQPDPSLPGQRRPRSARRHSWLAWKPPAPGCPKPAPAMMTCGPPWPASSRSLPATSARRSKTPPQLPEPFVDPFDQEPSGSARSR